MSEYIAKASIEPRDYRVVFLIQKAGIPIRVYPHKQFLFLPYVGITQIRSRVKASSLLSACFLRKLPVIICSFVSCRSLLRKAFVSSYKYYVSTFNAKLQCSAHEILSPT